MKHQRDIMTWSVSRLALAILLATAGTAAAQAGEDQAGDGQAASVQASAETADNEQEGLHFEAAGILGYGTNLASDSVPAGFNFGARGGMVLPGGLYLGLHALALYGDGDSTTTEGLTFSRTVWQFQLGAEVGKDFDLGAVTLRPYAGLGLNTTTVSYRVSDGFNTAGLNETAGEHLYLAAGGTLLFQLTDKIFGGVDVRYSLVLADPLRHIPTIGLTGGAVL